MAYVFSTVVNQSDTGSSDSTFIPTNPIHDVDDIIMHIITNDNGGTTITEGTSGWTEIGTQSQRSGSRSAIFWKKATTATTADPEFYGASDGWAIVSIAIRDADTTTPIDVIAQTNEAGPVNQPVCPTATTTTADCLILRCCCGWDAVGSYAYHDGTYKMLPIAFDNCSSIVSVKNQSVAGATGTFTYDHSRSDGGNLYTIAIRNKSGGGIEPDFTSGLSYETRAFGQFGLSGSETTPTFTTLYSSITTIGGVGVTSTAIVDTGNYDLINSGFNTSATRVRFSDATSGVIFGATFPHTANLSGLKVIVNLAATFNVMAAIGRLFILFDSAGNWAAYNSPLSEGKAISTAYPLFFDETSTPFDSSGTLDWTDIVKIGFGAHKRGASTTIHGFALSTFATLSPYIFTGCNSARPITPASLAPWMEQPGIVGIANLQGTGQLLSRVSVQIGDGSTETHFKAEAQSFELPSLYGKGQNNWAIGEGNIDVIIYTSANDVIDFASSIFATASSQNFTINASSSTSASFDFSGCSLVGWDVTWLTGVDCDQAAFIGCANIDGKAATFSSCIIKSSTATTAAMKLNTGASVTDCNFTKGDESYALNLQDAGTYDLSNNSYSGYTKPLYISATTGTVTITLAFGESQPTYDSDGATVAFNQPQSVGSVTNIVAGSRIQVWNTTTASEIANEIVAGTTYTLNYDDGVEFTSGDTVRIRLTRQATTTAYLEFQQSATVALAGWSVLADQQADTVYNGMGIDGSTVTKFSADYIDNEIDLDVASNFAMSEFYPWWVYNMTTENGIREFYGAIEAEDAANIKNDTTVLGLHWDNTTASNVYQTDNIRFYRSDGAYPVKDPTTGGGGIDIVWKNQIFIAETTTSGLTAQESADLAIIKTRTGLIPATV